LPELTTDQYIAIIAALCAVASAIYARQSAISARRALEISESDHRERHSEVSGYLIDGVTWDVDGADRSAAFACSVSNTASAPVSIIRSELHLHTYGKDGAVAEVVLFPVAEEEPVIWNLKRLSLPINLGARTTESGWISFRIPGRVFESMSIDRYEIKFVTSSGGSASVEQYLVRRIVNASGKD
jgi:hypothetical protein